MVQCMLNRATGSRFGIKIGQVGSRYDDRIYWAFETVLYAPTG